MSNKNIQELNEQFKSNAKKKNVLTFFNYKKRIAFKLKLPPKKHEGII